MIRLPLNGARIAGSFFLFIIIFFVVFLSSPDNIYAYQRPDAISLNGSWEFLPVPPLVELVADRSGSFDPPQLSPELSEVIPESARISAASNLPGMSGWVEISVPSAWEQVAGIDYNGAGWYRRKISIPKDWLTSGQRIWIEFDAVATAAGVWVNRQWLGGHVGDYVRWRVEATATVQTGENEILVYVDELPGHITQGFLSVVAPHHGGIWQAVRLYRSGPLSLLPDGIEINSNTGSGEVTLTLQFDAPWPGGAKYPKLRISRYHPGEKASPENLITNMKNIDIFNDASNRRLIYQVKLNSFELWSPEEPNLYRASLEIPGSKKKEIVHQKFAFREIRIDGSTVMLNGKPLNIRSVLNWGYYPRLVSPAPPPNVIREEFRYYRSLGFNAETICLMIMPDYFYDIADETGMLIWEEYPTWHNDFSQRELATYRRVFPAYFKRDRHHPSIILRSISVEAGVKDQEVMGELVQLAKKMTDTPVQDNSSWFWLSNEELTDWYGEDNYWNNDRWARHMLVDLPAKLDEMPVKPYIIGETIAGTVWPDIPALLSIKPEIPLANGVTGTDQAHHQEIWPYWFPSCFESCREVEQKFREKYNALLPTGEDIIRDYLLPQSRDYALNFRKFQIPLLYSDPRYAGWTLFLGRDVPNCHSGLYDNLGRPRWQPEAWDWMHAGTRPPVTVSEISGRDKTLPLFQLAPELQHRHPEWKREIHNHWPIYYLTEGYSALQEIFISWPEATGISEAALEKLPPEVVLATTVLTRKVINFLEGGGKVMLITSRWPGALGSVRNMYWADAVFVPPGGPLSVAERQQLPLLQSFDLTHHKSEAIPVQGIGIEWEVDPIIRLLEIHGLDKVAIHDQLFATRVGDGLMLASSLDHTAAAGQWLLGRLTGWAKSWSAAESGFPNTRLAPEKLATLAVERANSIVLLNENWRFQLDPDQEGEKLGWAAVNFDDHGWPMIQAARMWEGQGYSYDGMAWYRKQIDFPREWTGKRIYLVAEGVDDAYQLWINGKMIARYGSFTEHAQTVFRTKTETDITPYLQLGKMNTLVLQVVDVFGGGGITQPIYLRVE